MRVGMGGTLLVARCAAGGPLDTGVWGQNALCTRVTKVVIAGVDVDSLY